MARARGTTIRHIAVRCATVAVGLVLTVGTTRTCVAAQQTVSLRSIMPVATRAGSAGTTQAQMIGFVPPEPDAKDAAAGSFGSAVVSVELSDRGKLMLCRVLRSSGNSSLDERARRAVAAASFRAATIGGRPVGGAYIVIIGFDVDD
jgi:TonB family protein